MDDKLELLAYSRHTENSHAIVFFNLSDKDQLVKVPVAQLGRYVDPLHEEYYDAKAKSIEQKIQAKSGKVLIIK